MEEKGLEFHFERAGNLPLIVRLSSLLSSFSGKTGFLPLPRKFSFFELVCPNPRTQGPLERLITQQMVNVA